MATELKPFLKEIADAIRNKTGSTEPINAQNFATEISNIQAGGGEDRLKKLLDATKTAGYLFSNYEGTSVDDLIKYNDTSNVTNMSSMFSGCQKLTSIPLLNTSKVTNISGMFGYCRSLKTIPSLDTSSVTSISSMFSNCTKLTSIPLLNTGKATNMDTMFANCYLLTTIPSLDTSSVTSMYSMFSGCESLTSIPLLNTGKVTKMANMFANCYLLTTIPLSDTSSVTNMGGMFNSCYSLTKVIIYNSTKVPPSSTNLFTKCYHFLGTVNEKYNPDGLKDGRIYVPDDMVESFKTETNWSVFADQILPLSELPPEEQL